MVTVLRLTLHQLGGRWRLALIFLLAALPIGLSALVSATLSEADSSNEEFTSFEPEKESLDDEDELEIPAFLRRQKN